MHYVQASLKRLLYNWCSGKSLFNLVHYTRRSHGTAKSWASEMVPPSAQALREAEAFLETIAPVDKVNLLDGIRCALQQECDAVYIISSGPDPRMDPNMLLQAVRQLNLREAAIYTIGVDSEPQAEEFLRRLAETNHGEFRAKPITTRALYEGNNIQPTAKGGRERATRDKLNRKLTLGGQTKIVEVMVEEHTRHEGLWLEEQKCANLLLLASMTQGAVPGPQDARHVRQVIAEKQQTRLGGGYLYLDDNETYTPLRACFQRATSASPDDPTVYAEPPPSGGQVRSSVPHGSSRYNERLGMKVASTKSATSFDATALRSTAPTLRKPSLANPWDRPEGVQIKVGETWQRMQDKAKASRRGAPRVEAPPDARSVMTRTQPAPTVASTGYPSYAVGAVPRRSEDIARRTERGIAARREAARRPAERSQRVEVSDPPPSGWNLQRRWSF